MEHNQLTIKTFMAIMTERDAAIRERNMALEERKRAFAERDMAMLQRDAALAERNSAMQERNEAIAALRFRRSSMNDNNMIHGNGIVHGITHIHSDQHQMNHMFDLGEAKYEQREILTSDAFHDTGVPPETAKAKKVRQTKEGKSFSPKPAESPRLGKRGAKSLSNQMTPDMSSNSWKTEPDLSGDEENQIVAWKDKLGLNQVIFDESAMPTPICSCTGSPQACYKWGNGGWQSACCTTTMSMYPLPQASNKKYSRVSGRKMSGSVFTKLLNRLADEGHELFKPLDLKDHWAKHGTNRYSTLR